MKQIDEIKVDELVIAPMFIADSIWVARGSRHTVDAQEWWPTNANRKNYEYWAFKVLTIDTKQQLAQLSIPNIRWKRLKIMNWWFRAWVPMQYLQKFDGLLCEDCGYLCAQKCKKALRKNP